MLPLLLAFLAAVLGAFVYRRFAPLDVPNERSSHSRPVPRAGGVAIVLGFAIGLLAWLVSGNALSPRALGWLGGAALVTAVSFVDDVRSLPVGPRLAVHALGALLLTVVGVQERELPLLLALPLAFVWVALVTNVYNCMDGIDGLNASLQVISPADLWSKGAVLNNMMVTIGGGLIAAASAGFLAHNLPPARLFMGDVGSTFLGFNFAGLSLLGNLGVGGGRLPIEFGVVVLAPFLFDSMVTLARRVVRGERWYTAHRSHFYQRLVTHGLSHAQVTGLYAALAVVAAVAALLGLVLEEPLRQALAIAAYAPMLAVVALVWRLDASHVVTPGRSL